MKLDVVILGQEIDALQKKRPWLTRFIPRLFRPDPVIQAHLQNLLKLLEVARTRTGPPRCLLCSGTAITELQSEGETTGVTHSCGGSMFWETIDFNGLRISFKGETITLDREGHKIVTR